MPELGPYEILGEVGRGGMGVVYRAHDPAIGRFVALKVIRLDAAAGHPSELEFLRSRLFREARAAGALSHPNIVTIYQIAEHGGVAYIAMEFIGGATLQQILASGPPLRRDLALKILCQAAEALDYAHGKGIIHRDIKPANIMLSEHETVKICDFGIAKLTSGQTATPSGMTLGTPYYMAPEQLGGTTVDGRADQYSLAAVAYQVLTGQRPHPGDTLPEVFYSILHRQPEPAHCLNPSLPEESAAILTRALAKNPGERFRCCTEFSGALRRSLQASDWRPAWREAPPPQREPVAVARAEGPGQCRHCGARVEPGQVECGFCASLQSTGGTPGGSFGSGAVPRPAPGESPGATAPAEPGPQSPGVVMVPPGQATPGGAYQVVAAALPTVAPSGRGPRRLVAGLAAAVLGAAAVLVVVYYSRSGTTRPREGVRPPSPVETAKPALDQPPPEGEGAVPAQKPPALTPRRSSPSPVPERPAPSPPPAPTAVAAPERKPGGGAASEPVASSGATAPWPMLGGNRQRTGVALVSGPRQPVIAWQVQLGGQLREAPVIAADGTAYIAAADGRLYAVRRGEVQWSGACGGPPVSAPRIHEFGLLSVRVQPNQIRCFHLDGGIAPCPPTSGLVPEPSAESLEGRIFFTEGTLLRQLGDSTWRVDLGELAATGPAVAPDGRILVGTASGVLFAVDDRARVRWSYRAPVRITAGPAVEADGDVFFGCGDRNLYCVRNGELRWRFATSGPVYSGPIIDRTGVVYFGSTDGHLYALSDEGEELWKLNLQNEVRASPSLDQGGRLYVGTVGRWLYCISDRTQPR